MATGRGPCAWCSVKDQRAPSFAHLQEGHNRHQEVPLCWSIKIQCSAQAGRRQRRRGPPPKRDRCSVTQQQAACRTLAHYSRYHGIPSGKLAWWFKRLGKQGEGRELKPARSAASPLHFVPVVTSAPEQLHHRGSRGADGACVRPVFTHNRGCDSDMGGRNARMILGYLSVAERNTNAGRVRQASQNS